jgi:hypothetical protein
LEPLVGYDSLFGVFLRRSKDDFCSASSEEPAFQHL